MSRSSDASFVFLFLTCLLLSACQISKGYGSQPGPSPREPKISAISPHRVIEGGPDLAIVIDGAGFVTHSVVRVDGVSLATTFENPDRLRGTIPANFIESALPDPYRMAGPDQNVGVHGNRLVSFAVLNPPPSG